MGEPAQRANRGVEGPVGMRVLDDIGGMQRRRWAMPAIPEVGIQPAQGAQRAARRDDRQVVSWAVTPSPIRLRAGAVTTALPINATVAIPGMAKLLHGVVLSLHPQRGCEG